MNFTINDVDQVIERTGCSYKEAKDALIESDGVVIDAIIYLENRNKTPFSSFFRNLGEDTERTGDTILAKIKELISEGNATRLEVRDQSGRTLTGVSLNAGAAIGTLSILTNTAPLLVIAGLITRFGLNYRFVVIKKDGSETIL